MKILKIETLTPQEWYDALSIRQEVKLPDFDMMGRSMKNWSTLPKSKSTLNLNEDLR